MKSSLAGSAILVALMFPGVAQSDEYAERMAADIRGAEYSVLSSLVVHRSSGGKHLCTQNAYACVGMDRGELGLALIGGSKSGIAPQRLIELIRFELDGALGTDLQCYAAYRGNGLISLVDKADGKALSVRCSSELRDFRTRSRAEFDVGLRDICRSPEEIELAKQELRLAIKSGKDCGE